MVENGIESLDYHLKRSNTLMLNRGAPNILTRAFTSLSLHKKPITLPGIHRSSRHISFYDYLPQRKVWCEKDQRKRDRSRKIFRAEVQKELDRQQANEEARDKEMFPSQDDDGICEDGEECVLDRYFPSIFGRSSSAPEGTSENSRRRLSIRGLHTFFPEIENYDFAPRRPSDKSETNETGLTAGAHGQTTIDGLFGDTPASSGKSNDDNQTKHIERRVSFNLHPTRSNSLIENNNVGRSESDWKGRNRTSLIEISEIGKAKNVSNLIKHNSRLNLLHDSIEGNMELSRNMNERRILQRRAKSKSAITPEKPGLFYATPKFNSVGDTAMDNSPNQSTRRIVTQPDNFVITAPLISAMGVKRR